MQANNCGERQYTIEGRNKTKPQCRFRTIALRLKTSIGEAFRLKSTTQTITRLHSAPTAIYPRIYPAILPESLNKDKNTRQSLIPASHTHRPNPNPTTPCATALQQSTTPLTHPPTTKPNLQYERTALGNPLSNAAILSVHLPPPPPVLVVNLLKPPQSPTLCPPLHAHPTKSATNTHRHRSSVRVHRSSEPSYIYIHTHIDNIFFP